MKGTVQLIITVRFPEWEVEEAKFPAFGVKYLIKVPTEIEEQEELVNYFKNAFLKKIGKPFDGEILFFEEVEYVTLN